MGGIIATGYIIAFGNADYCPLGCDYRDYNYSIPLADRIRDEYGVILGGGNDGFRNGG
jgi:hypothetical protein